MLFSHDQKGEMLIDASEVPGTHTDERSWVQVQVLSGMATQFATTLI